MRNIGNNINFFSMVTQHDHVYAFNMILANEIRYEIISQICISLLPFLSKCNKCKIMPFVILCALGARVA
jgi:hypothetical protein